MNDDDARKFVQWLRHLECQTTHMWRHVSSLEDVIASLMDAVFVELDEKMKMRLVTLNTGFGSSVSD